MTYAPKSIASRIDWCRQQSTQARAPRELEGWQAEEEGLRDALFNRDQMTQYQQGPLGVFERYAMGLQDGHALLRTAAVYYHFATPTRTAGICDVRMRRVMGLTRRAETDSHECRVTGDDSK
ncbi:MAG: hypothetical protein ABIQ24_02010 [Nitrospiraceae bacterium]